MPEVANCKAKYIRDLTENNKLWVVGLDASRAAHLFLTSICWPLFASINKIILMI